MATEEEDLVVKDPAAFPVGKRAALLEGVTVLDLTRYLAGPFGSMILGDLGADVIKVEQLEGDSTRWLPPYSFHGDGAYFMSINRNKRSIALNIRSAEGRDVLERLIAKADILLDNLRAPQREQLKLTYPHISKINPQIISCSVTGFGSDGPYEDRPAFAIIVEALAGVMSVTGPEGGPSVRSGPPIGDTMAGTYAALAALAGLEYRRKTGHGQHIDVGMLDSQVSLLCYLVQYYLTGGMVATHQGQTHVGNPLYNVFKTKDDREIVVAASMQDMWVRLCELLGVTELTKDPRFLTDRERLENRDVLVPLLRELIATWNFDDIYAALVKAEVPAAPINSIPEVIDDPQLRHRDMVVRVPHHSGHDYATLGSPMKPDDAIGTDFTSPPALGGDTRAVLTSLGYSEDEIEKLLAGGSVKADH
jgi:CoA:oxalate CoA-transferase